MEERELPRAGQRLSFRLANRMLCDSSQLVSRDQVAVLRARRGRLLGAGINADTPDNLISVFQTCEWSDSNNRVEQSTLRVEHLDLDRWNGGVSVRWDATRLQDRTRSCVC